MNIGESVGVIAAQSIGEPGTQLTMRTFHVGGIATGGAAADGVEARAGGTVREHNLKTVTNREGQRVAVSRSGEIGVVDANGQEKQRYKIPYGATIIVQEGNTLKAGERLARWDAHTHPIVSEIAGRVKFIDIEDGITVQREADELTGLSRLTVTDIKARGNAGKDLKPGIAFFDVGGKALTFVGTEIPAAYGLPPRAILNIEDGASVAVGDIVARIPQDTARSRDITGGLPRVADLFEARKPKDPAILADSTGTVKMANATKGKQKIKIIGPDGAESEQTIPKWTQLSVFEGEQVERGEQISEGEPSPHDILRLKGVADLADYLVKEIQDVYRLQGVRINDKHIETIIRQMLRKVEITDPGDSRFVRGEQVDIFHVLAENRKLKNDDKFAAKFDRQLLGITKASLSTESFISAASFQETTRVLTEASVRGSRDDLRGLKENVIVGRLIPAGTGLAYHEQRRKSRGGSILEEMQVSHGPMISDGFTAEHGETLRSDADGSVGAEMTPDDDGETEARMPREARERTAGAETIADGGGVDDADLGV